MEAEGAVAVQRWSAMSAWAKILQGPPVAVLKTVQRWSSVRGSAMSAWARNLQGPPVEALKAVQR
jgi:hypothetical protein